MNLFALLLVFLAHLSPAPATAPTGGGGVAAYCSLSVAQLEAIGKTPERARQQHRFCKSRGY